MTPADKLASATVRMVLANGQGEGSGFHFIKPGIIVSVRRHRALSRNQLTDDVCISLYVERQKQKTREKKNKS